MAGGNRASSRGANSGSQVWWQLGPLLLLPVACAGARVSKMESSFPCLGPGMRCLEVPGAEFTPLLRLKGRERAETGQVAPEPGRLALHPGPTAY